MKTKVWVLFLGISLMTSEKSMGQQDLVINIHEKTVNKLMAAIGDIVDSSSYKALFVNINYNWRVRNAKIKVAPPKVFFYAEVRVEAGFLKYDDYIEGNAEVTYNPATNKIELRIVEAKFPIKVKIRKKEKIIKEVDLASYFSEPFSFEGPMAYEEEFEFEMPDGSIKKLKTVIVNYDLVLLKEIIQMKAELDFEELKEPVESKPKK